MQTRSLNQFLIIIFSICFIVSCQSNTGETNRNSAESKTISANDTISPIVKSEEEWRKILTEEEFTVLRQHGTERAFTGDLLNIKTDGTYTCAACGLALFESETKFESGTGWPSFYDIISKKHVQQQSDDSYGMKRTEVHCGRCKGHLGHVFDDGPQPTGLRYCINSVSLDFEPAKKP